MIFCCAENLGRLGRHVCCLQRWWHHFLAIRCRFKVAKRQRFKVTPESALLSTIERWTVRTHEGCLFEQVCERIHERASERAATHMLSWRILSSSSYRHHQQQRAVVPYFVVCDIRLMVCACVSQRWDLLNETFNFLAWTHKLPPKRQSFCSEWLAKTRANQPKENLCYCECELFLNTSSNVGTLFWSPAWVQRNLIVCALWKWHFFCCENTIISAILSLQPICPYFRIFCTLLLVL